ncbi:MAG TPA: hypothetical protein VG937_22455 [Polyangiaceae bacterium]|nr:hypothetical protein [Polyangiaceae bacterium]
MTLKTTLSHIALATLALVANACTLQKTDDVSEYREALPVADSVKVAGPDADGGGSRSNGIEGSSSSLMAAGDGANANVAKWYAFTRNVRDGVNVVTRDVLAGVWVIVHSEPTTVAENQAVWGPYTEALDPATYRFRVERVADGEYDYTLEGRPKASTSDADYRAVLSGKGYGRLDARHGDGKFTIDLDAAKALDPSRHQDDSGTVTITHDLPPNISRQFGALPRTINAEVTPQGEAWIRIGSQANEDGTGAIHVDAHVDVDDSKATLLEDVSVQSRWKVDGAGRADITVAGGDLPATIPMVSATECWGEDFSRVFYSDSVGFEANVGAATSCVYSEPAP